MPIDLIPYPQTWLTKGLKTRSLANLPDLLIDPLSCPPVWSKKRPHILGTGWHTRSVPWHLYLACQYGWQKTPELGAKVAYSIHISTSHIACQSSWQKTSELWAWVAWSIHPLTHCLVRQFGWQKRPQDLGLCRSAWSTNRIPALPVNMTYKKLRDLRLGWSLGFIVALLA